MIEGEDRKRLVKVIEHLEATTDDQWLCDRVRQDGRNCVMGHVFSMGGGDERLSNEWWDWFEWTVASTFMIYPVNDGRHPQYQQSTPRSRVLAYLDDVLNGHQVRTCEAELPSDDA